MTKTCFDIDLLRFNQTMTFDTLDRHHGNNNRPNLRKDSARTHAYKYRIREFLLRHYRSSFHLHYVKKREHTGNDRPLIIIYSDKNLKSFQNRLEGSDWDSILTGESSDETCKNFYNHVLKKFDEYFPLSLKSRKGSKDKKMAYKWPEEQHSEEALPV